MNLKGKFYRFKSEELIDSEMHPDNEAILINFDILSDSDKEAVVNSMDFTIKKDAVRDNTKINDEDDLGKPCWKLVDSQGANLANIQSDEFFVGDYDAIMDRLDNYYHDYGYYFLYELERLNVKYSVIEEIEEI